MAHFTDLTNYSYGYAPEEGSTPDLNVGWLQMGHPFPTAEPTREFVRSLICCCRRPVRLYCGFHTCDLCDVQVYEMPRVWYEGRCVDVGNGEIRVLGTDGRWYTAPTLVAHYVLAHRYCPPQQFVDGVLSAAVTTPCVNAEQLAKLASLTVADRFDLCLNILVQANETLAHPWVTRVIDALSRTRPFRNPTLWEKLWGSGKFQSQMIAVHEALVLPADLSARPPEWIHELAQNARRVRYTTSPAEALEFVATAVECALASGLDLSLSEHVRSGS